MAGALDGRRVAILAADGVERVELEQPRHALEGAGAHTDVVSINGGEIQARDNDLVDSGTFAVNRLVNDVTVDDYDALTICQRSASASWRSSRRTPSRRVLEPRHDLASGGLPARG